MIKLAFRFIWYAMVGGVIATLIDYATYGVISGIPLSIIIGVIIGRKLIKRKIK